MLPDFLRKSYQGKTVPNTFAPSSSELELGTREPVNVRQSDAPVGGVYKRCFDILASGTALLLLSPLMLGLALLIRLSSSGPALYGHSRIGYNGRKFRCWKFRSMVVDGDAVLENHFAQNPEARAEWEETQKLKDDPRVTSIGRVIRALSVDELPQLLNIFMGDMSVVGPRPVTGAELDRYGVSALHYLRSRPGLTGLWQVSGRSNISYRRRVLMDRYYVSNWSFLSDIMIILRTVPAVLFARGSR